MNQPRSTEGIVREEGAKLDFARDMSYGDYLQLDAILNAQKPLSPDHNEMLFIVQHQTSELWMKLMLHELTAAMRHIEEDELPDAFKMLARVSQIMAQLVHAWDVLATMTPPEYSAIRPYLAQSSGFQSWQYRCIEFSMGNKNQNMLIPHAHRPDLHEIVEKAFCAPSLYDVSLKLLARRGSLAFHQRDQIHRAQCLDRRSGSHCRGSSGSGFLHPTLRRSRRGFRTAKNAADDSSKNAHASRSFLSFS